MIPLTEGRRGGARRREHYGREEGEEEENRRRGMPPTEPVVGKSGGGGLGCPQETVVAPSQASHQAVPGHPVVGRQTHQMAWTVDQQGFVYFSSRGGREENCSAQAVY